MKQTRNTSVISKIFGIIITVIALAVMGFFAYGLVKVSLQNGDSSSAITNNIATRIASAIFDDTPTEDQLFVMNRILRFSAHIVLFALLGYGLGAVGFLFFRTGITREISIILDFGICAAFSYFTEYYKQFVAGRHFQMEDVRINFCGALFGICFFLLSCALHGLISMRTKHKDR